MKSLIVCVHDVAPQHWHPLGELVRELRLLVDGNLSAAVVPRWQGGALASDGAGSGEFTGWVKESFTEILLHGYTHYSLGRQTRALSPIGWLTGDLNEFTGLTVDAAREKLRLGQAILTQAFGAPAKGFVPPAWQWGPLTPALLGECGLSFGVGLTRWFNTDGQSQALATWSWDAGRFAVLGYMGEGLGDLTHRLQPDAIPCIVLHPLDVERGFLPRILSVLKSLLQQGYQPVTFEECRR